MSDRGVGTLEEQAHAFSESVAGLLAACFPDAPGMHVTELDDRVRIRPDGQGPQSGGVPLLARGQQLAWMRFHYSCRLDQTEEYLAIDYSNVWIVSSKDRTPLFRFEYAYDSLTKPHAHIQVHGERGTLSHLLSRTRHGKPHDMSALHLPTGGARFRPNLEDVVQFLLQDCQFDAVDGWLDAVHERRAHWRAIQTGPLPARWRSRLLRSCDNSVTPSPHRPMATPSRVVRRATPGDHPRACLPPYCAGWFCREHTGGTPTQPGIFRGMFSGWPPI